MRRDSIIYDCDLWQEIDSRRKGLGMSVVDFCHHARISRVAYYRYAKGMGMYPPTMRRLLRLLVHLEGSRRA